MSTTNINIRVDSSLKEQAEKLFSELGMNMTTAITVFLRSAVSYEGIPFEIRKNTPNEETKAALAEYEAMKNDSTTYKRYDSFDDLLNEVTTSA